MQCSHFCIEYLTKLCLGGRTKLHQGEILIDAMPPAGSSHQYFKRSKNYWFLPFYMPNAYINAYRVSLFESTGDKSKIQLCNCSYCAKPSSATRIVGSNKTMHALTAVFHKSGLLLTFERLPIWKNTEIFQHDFLHCAGLTQFIQS